jgi:hypothetical protein
MRRIFSEKEIATDSCFCYNDGGLQDAVTSQPKLPYNGYGSGPVTTIGSGPLATR